MDIIYCIIGIILCIIAIIGSIIPGIPGPQLAYIGILLSQFLMDKPFSRLFIIIRGIVMIALIIIDYYFPILGTKKFGGSKYGNRGCIIGMIIGLFFGPIGLIGGPFVGALVGEYIHKKKWDKCFKPAFGAFIGFLSGTILKLIASIILLVYFCGGAYKYFSHKDNPLNIDNQTYETVQTME